MYENIDDVIYVQSLYKDFELNKLINSKEFDFKNKSKGDCSLLDYLFSNENSQNNKVTTIDKNQMKNNLENITVNNSVNDVDQDDQFTCANLAEDLITNLNCNSNVKNSQNDLLNNICQENPQLEIITNNVIHETDFELDDPLQNIFFYELEIDQSGIENKSYFG